MTFSNRRQVFRRLLAGSACVFPASVFDPVSARLAQSCGFELGMLAGSTASAAVLGAPDLVVLTLSEFAEQARRITRAATLPLMVDADHGYGNALNVMRTVEELESAGVAALTIEDTLLPRPFGRTERDAFISPEEFGGKLRAAVAARRDSELVIVGRTGVLPSQGAEAVRVRIEVCEQARVDGVFLTGVKSRDQVRRVHQMTALPLVLGTIPQELQEREFLADNGVRVALQGHIPLRMAAKALEQAYEHLRAGRPPDELEPLAATAETMQRVLAQDDYRDRTEKYLE